MIFEMYICFISGLFVMNSILNTLLKIYIILNEDDVHKEIPENIKKTMYS